MAGAPEFYAPEIGFVRKFGYSREVMPISEEQLDAWKNVGAVTTSAATHESIRRAIAANAAVTRAYTPDPFLQGSYKNTTNVRGNSDVDLVAFSRDAHYADLPVDTLRASIGWTTSPQSEDLRLTLGCRQSAGFHDA